MKKHMRRGRPSCAGCVYNRCLGSSLVCYYALDNGVLRGGLPQDCDKHVKKTPKSIVMNKLLITSIRMDLKKHKLSYVAQRHNIPKETIEAAIKLYEKSAKEAKEAARAEKQQHEAERTCQDDEEI